MPDVYSELFQVYESMGVHLTGGDSGPSKMGYTSFASLMAEVNGDITAQQALVAKMNRQAAKYKSLANGADRAVGASYGIRPDMVGLQNNSGWGVLVNAGMEAGRGIISGQTEQARIAASEWDQRGFQYFRGELNTVQSQQSAFLDRLNLKNSSDTNNNFRLAAAVLEDTETAARIYKSIAIRAQGDNKEAESNFRKRFAGVIESLPADQLDNIKIRAQQLAELDMINLINARKMFPQKEWESLGGSYSKDQAKEAKQQAKQQKKNKRDDDDQGVANQSVLNTGGGQAVQPNAVNQSSQSGNQSAQMNFEQGEINKILTQNMLSPEDKRTEIKATLSKWLGDAVYQVHKDFPTSTSTPQKVDLQSFLKEMHLSEQDFDAMVRATADPKDRRPIAKQREDFYKDIQTKASEYLSEPTPGQNQGFQQQPVQPQPSTSQPFKANLQQFQQFRQQIGTGVEESHGPTGVPQFSVPSSTRVQGQGTFQTNSTEAAPVAPVVDKNFDPMAPLPSAPSINLEQKFKEMRLKGNIKQ